MGIRHMVRTTPLACVAMFAGAAIAIGSCLWLSADGGALALAGVIAGVLLEMSGPMAHDRWHLRRDETPHAMWGRGDARRPTSLGGPRIRGEW